MKFNLRNYLKSNPLLTEATDPKAEQVIKAVMRRYGRTRKEAIDDLVDMGVLSGYGDYQFVPKTRLKGTSDEYVETVEDKIASYYRNNDIEVVKDTEEIPDIKADFEIEDEEEVTSQEKEEEPEQDQEVDVTDYDEKDFIDNYREFEDQELEVDAEVELEENLKEALKIEFPDMSDEEIEEFAKSMIDEIGEDGVTYYIAAATNTQKVEELPDEVQDQEMVQAQNELEELQSELEQAKDSLETIRKELDSLPGGDKVYDSMKNGLDSLTGGGSPVSKDGGAGIGAKADGTGGEGDGGFGFNWPEIPAWLLYLIIFLMGVVARGDRKSRKNESLLEREVRVKLNENRLGSNYFSSLKAKWSDFAKKYKGRASLAGARSILAFLNTYKKEGSLYAAARKAIAILGAEVSKRS